MNRSQWLYQVVKPHLGTVKQAAEIGVWRGDYSVEIILALKPEHFYAVDPYQYNPEYSDIPDEIQFANQHNLDQLYHQVQNRMNLLGANLIRKTGADASADFHQHSLQFLYIDSEHTEHTLSAELDAWWPKIAPGGILSGHDYTPGNPEKGHVYGVIPAVNAFAKKHNLLIQHTTEQYATWWVTAPSALHKDA